MSCITVGIMRSRGLQIALFLLILAVWIASFFLPALYLDKNVIGYMAALLSADVMYTFARSHQLQDLYLGSFWLANVFLLASPFALWRAWKGKAGAFITLLAFWDVLTLSFAIYCRVRHDLGSVLIGWYVWEASLVAMPLLLLLI